MPKTREANDDPLAPEYTETLTRAAHIIYVHMSQALDPDLLYKGRELMPFLKARTRIDSDLKALGLSGLTLRGCGTPLTPALHNMWRNGLVQKFATGIFIKNGRPIGVTWQLK